MTVGELINWLSEFNEDAEVVIGMQQRYGSDFAMEVDEVSEEEVSSFWGDDEDNPQCVVITEGSQIGTVCYKRSDDDYEY